MGDTWAQKMAAALFWERNTAVCKKERRLACRSHDTDDDHGRLVKRGRGKGASPHFFFSIISQLRSIRRQSLASSPLDTQLGNPQTRPSQTPRHSTLIVSFADGEIKKIHRPHKPSPQSLSHSRQLSSTWQSRDSHALCDSFALMKEEASFQVAAAGRLVSGSLKTLESSNDGRGWVHRVHTGPQFPTERNVHDDDLPQQKKTAGGGWRRGRLGGGEVALTQCPMWGDGVDVGWGVKGKIGAF